ncbi:MAG TPA: MoaD/ThiS family protein [Flavobacteriales bacterium]|nr:MoaD/ThiS family protein [Flavobacteriales bacterium]
MKLNVKYFGMIAEWAGSENGQLDFSGTSVVELRSEIEKRIPGLNSSSYQIAVNRVIATDEAIITLGDEIAILPPFAGG